MKKFKDYFQEESLRKEGAENTNYSWYLEKDPYLMTLNNIELYSDHFLEPEQTIYSDYFKSKISAEEYQYWEYEIKIISESILNYSYMEKEGLGNNKDYFKGLVSAVHESFREYVNISDNDLESDYHRKMKIGFSLIVDAMDKMKPNYILDNSRYESANDDFIGHDLFLNVSEEDLERYRGMDDLTLFQTIMEEDFGILPSTEVKPSDQGKDKPPKK